MLKKGKDYYEEGGFWVFTAVYHKKRGFCCGTGCRHCPYMPTHKRGSTEVKAPKAASKNFPK